MMKFAGLYARNILIAIDQLANAVLAGDPDETISSRAAKRLHIRGWAALASVLERIDPGHMARSIEADEGGDAAWRAVARAIRPGGGA